MTDYNGEMRRGGRGGGGGYRMPSSKDMGPADMGPYGEKVSVLSEWDLEHLSEDITMTPPTSSVFTLLSRWVAMGDMSAAAGGCLHLEACTSLACIP